MKSRAAVVLLSLAGLLISTGASAHPDHELASGFWHGLAHPFTGLDHLLVMVAVGLWALQLGGTARWQMPAAFVLLLVGGAMLAMAGISLPFIEPALLFSVIAMGLVIAAAVRVPAAAGMALVGLFALFHGFAHSAEMPAGLHTWSYTSGFVLATALLHSGGLLAAIRLSSRHTRLLGSAIALAGGVLVLAN